MLVLILADCLCFVSFIYPLLCGLFPEIGTSSIDWAQLRWLLPGDRDRAQSTKQHLKKTGQWLTSKKSIIVLKTSVCVTVTPQFLLVCTSRRQH
jgi:hypothetical protein